MLFDLQSRGRRTAVKIIYLGLAVLMGGGLLLFGVGAGNGIGGFLDVFRGNGQSQTAQVSNAEKTATRQVRLHPQDPRAWYALAYARYQSADSGYDQTLNNGNGGFTDKGRAKLSQAATAWQRYLTLEPHPSATLAQFMANAYSQAGLDQPAEAASAMQIVTAARPSYQGYATLAEYAYLANEMRLGDLAAGKAVSLAPSAQQKLIRNNLATIKRQVTQQGARSGTGGGVAGAG